MAISACLTAFAVGVAVSEYKVFPYRHIHAGMKTLSAMRLGATPYAGDVLDEPLRPTDSRAARVAVLSPAAGSEPLLLYGGLNQYRELCPEHGCVAVKVDARGGLLQAIPYLPDQIAQANMTPQFKYEGQTDLARNNHPIGIKMLPSGDLLVVGQRNEEAPLFPFGTGVALLRADGRPKWFRFDYSHHWPTVAPDGRLLITSSTLGEENGRVVAGHDPGGVAKYSVSCEGDRPYHDIIRVLDASGRVTREIPVLEAIAASPFAPTIRFTTNPCSPIHLNYIDVLRPSAAGAIPGAKPGDFVISLRTISAFGVIDADTGRLTRMFHGSFREQHSVHHLEGSKFLMFDNQGDYARGGSSRLLEVDVATGQERTIFPAASTPPELRRLYSETAGYLDISPDRSRAFVTFTEAGRAVEVRLSDGLALREVSNIHEVVGATSAQNTNTPNAALFRLYGVDYLTH